MQIKRFNDNWTFNIGEGDAFMAARNGATDSGNFITLPHDAMIHEERRPDAPSGSQSGFYPGGFYTYQKYFDVPIEYKDKHLLLEFEGVYMNAKVYVNEHLAGGHPYGYSNFYVDLDDFLDYGKTNRIRVIANNANEPNSRWYSGSGIYRDVNLLIGEKVRIPQNGVRITTKDIKENLALLEIKTSIENEVIDRERATLSIEILDADGHLAGRDQKIITLFKDKPLTITNRVIVKNPKLWSDETPNLYTVKISLSVSGYEDTVCESFGIRQISVDPINGLCVNGKTVKLRGTCIHHDNGIIGAATFKDAEERRAKKLKEAGFNCIRSAHHPMGKTMLEICDRLGIYVMDELSDVWTLSKNPQDYSLYFADYWETDLLRMVEKDYNHPSVILYRTGNEIPEAATPHGANLNRTISDAFKVLDDTRFTTSAINTLIACSEDLPRIVESMSEMLDDPENRFSASGGVNAMNALMAMFMRAGGEEAFASNPLTSELIQEYVEACDINGYNYLTARHIFDHEDNENRVVLGTETFPADIVRLWDVVKKYDHVIGDLTWTGYDYLGEAGCAIFYYDGTENFSSHWPDRLAYMGDINLIGYRRPLSYLREIVYGLRKAPYISVERVNRYGMPHSGNPWMFKDCIASWTFDGYEGKPAKVDVFSPAKEVELFLNGRSLGKKPCGEENGYMASYEITYEPGILSVTDSNKESFSLTTAGSAKALNVTVENEVLKADEASLSFVTVGLSDEDGNPNPWAVKNIEVKVEGAGTLQGFGNAAPQSTGSFDDTIWPTFDGYVMAVIRAGKTPGKIKVTISSPDLPPVVKEITVI